MINERLYINNIYIPLEDGINPSITRSIADVKEPNKRKGTYSKTATVPDSVEAREGIAQIFNLSSDNGSFDPTVKATCRYFVGNNQLINGYCQLKKVNITDLYKITYDIVMYDSSADFFSEIGDQFLHDLDLSRWDHPFDKDVQADSWDTQVWDADAAAYIPFALGTGYVYPLIDYGFSSDATTFQTDHIPCALYVKEYWDAIFSAAGFSYTSTFLTGTIFKSLIIPSSPESYVLNSTEIDERKFDADTPNFTSSASDTTGNLSLESLGSDDVIIFTSENSDTSGIYDHTNGKWTVSDGGWYTINSELVLSATFTPASQPAALTAEIRGKIRALVNSRVIDEIPFFITRDSGTATSDWPYSTAYPATYSDLDYLADAIYYPWSSAAQPRAFNPPNQYNISTSGVWLEAGDEVEIAIAAGFFNGTEDSYFDDAGGSPVAGNATLTVEEGWFKNEVENTTLFQGSTLTIDKIIPKDIKQADFIMSLVKMFNLYFDVDENDPKKLTIEPRDDFYGSDKVDITNKIAWDRGVDIFPMGEMNARRYLYEYKEDKDYYNEKYLTRWKEDYGDREIVVNNEFVQKDEVNKIIFSSTPLVGLPGSTRVMPTIIELDDLGQAKNTKHNIRIMYYGGLKSSNDVWYHTEVNGYATVSITDRTTYPYCGHFDDPFSPTLDINFGLVKEVYHDSNINTIIVTNNNLWNKYWSSLIGEITDKESKTVKCWVNVTPKDFKRWSFQDLYWFNNAYHRLNKIEGYNPTNGSLTKCEFLKLKSVPAFSASTYPVDEANDPITGPPFDNLDTNEDAPTTAEPGSKSVYMGDENFFNPKTVQINGEGNRVSKSAKDIIIDGDDNTVMGGAENIKLVSSNNNTIDPGVKNVTLINTDDLTITLDDTNFTFIDGKKKGSVVRETSTSFIVDDTVEIYYLDGSSNQVQARLNGSESEFIFKSVDASNKTYIDFGAYDYDNTGKTTITLKKDESIRVKWDSTDTTYFIIN